MINNREITIRLADILSNLDHLAIELRNTPSYDDLGKYLQAVYDILAWTLQRIK